jgi:CHAT domain-containing protein
LLIGHDRGLYRFTSPAGSADLLASARRFRYRLESDYGTYRYLDEAEFLHQQLIEPALGKLRELGVRHLVFVPDGALGNIPLAALRDRHTGRYLLEDFSLSIAPNLSLLEPPVEARKTTPLLLGGLSTATQGFAAIPSVALEVNGIAPLYPDREVLRDRDFTAAAIADGLLKSKADVVHLASHGEFLGRAENCYLLTHDGRITLDQIEMMIRPRKFVGTPVSLLCLSACRTAAGDDRAALGLAGATVKSGARSVLATLWYVEDQSAAALMTSFHRHLRGSSSGNKAEALRRAQLDVLQADHSAHPSRWAPFVLVGSWR